MAIEVRNQPDQRRYEVVVDGEVGGYSQYIRQGDRVIFVHTEIDPAFEGQGLGGILARGALDDVRASGRRVIARCPFIAGWLERHPEYADLVVQDAS